MTCLEFKNKNKNMFIFIYTEKVQYEKYKLKCYIMKKEL